MPLVDGKNLSPDEAIHLGLCPECGAPVTPGTAISHARSHWNPDTLAPSSEARRRYDLLAQFVQWGSTKRESTQRSQFPVSAKSPETSFDTSRPFWIDPVIAAALLTQGLGLLFSEQHFLGWPAWMFGAAFSVIGVGWLWYHRSARRAASTLCRVPNTWTLTTSAIVVIAMIVTGYDACDRHYGVAPSRDTVAGNIPTKSQLQSNGVGQAPLNSRQSAQTPVPAAVVTVVRTVQAPCPSAAPTPHQTQVLSLQQNTILAAAFAKASAIIQPPQVNEKNGRLSLPSGLPCEVTITSSKENTEFRNMVRNIAEKAGCVELLSFEERPTASPSRPSLDADLIATPTPTAMPVAEFVPYIVVRASNEGRNGHGNWPEVLQAGDVIMQAFREMGLDARRSRKLVPPNDINTNVVYIELGNIAPWKN